MADAKLGPMKAVGWASVRDPGKRRGRAPSRTAILAKPGLEGGTASSETRFSVCNRAATFARAKAAGRKRLRAKFLAPAGCSGRAEGWARKIAGRFFRAAAAVVRAGPRREAARWMGRTAVQVWPCPPAGRGPVYGCHRGP